MSQGVPRQESKRVEKREKETNLQFRRRVDAFKEVARDVREINVE